MTRQTPIYTGLTEKDVRVRLNRDGYNELPSQREKSFFSIFLHVLSEPMLLLLLGTGGLYLVLGEPQDALMLLTFVFVVIGITLYQENKTERTLEALRDLSSPRALVIRNGQRSRIPGREVVVDDIIVLREGDRVPADAVVIEQENLSVDESLLTGESVHVRKAVWQKGDKSARPGGDDLPYVYSGTLIVSGRGVARVQSIGIQTEMGKIGKALHEVHDEETLLHKETSQVVKVATIAGLVLCVLTAIVYSITQGTILKGLLAGLTLGMAMLPEEFPVVLLVFLTLGAWRISKRKVLTRNAAAIETLGAATVLCVDKTGTLTQNKMTLVTLSAGTTFREVRETASAPLPESYHHLLEYSMLASQRDPYDPIEKEIHAIGTEYLQGTEHIHDQWTVVREYPLSKELLALSHVWKSPDSQSFVVAAKGAPEAIADLCHLSKSKKDALNSRIESMSARGLRVLGVAKATFTKKTLPQSQHDFGFEFVGLLGFLDPVRTTVPAAIREAYEAGMRVIMITGDYPGTASWIAREAGLKNPTNVIVGTELARMTQDELQDRIRSTNVFARTMPEQKLAIVMALKANGEIVAMTGDGVNDSPALKSANIGIAMGERGTDVAREASDLVLLNDDFSSIVAAVRLGRRIFDNLRRAMNYVIAVHVPIAGLSLFLPLFHLPIVLLPAHIALLELIIDPACSTVFEAEPEESNVMKRPPRPLSQRIFDPRTIGISVLQGVGILLSVVILLLYVLHSGKSDIEARTMAFSALVIANVLLIVTNLSWSENFIQILSRHNRALWSVIVGTFAALIIILVVPFARSLFHFSQLHTNDVIIVSAVAVVSVVWFEVIKKSRFLRC
jgi:Ca2+-transporting ATPase